MECDYGGDFPLPSKRNINMRARLPFCLVSFSFLQREIIGK